MHAKNAHFVIQRVIPKKSGHLTLNRTDALECKEVVMKFHVLAIVVLLVLMALGSAFA